MADKPRLSRQAMCDRVAMEFQDGWVVNLGVGIPTMCSNYVDPSRDIIYHSENGVIGYGPLAPEGEEIPHLVNAGAQKVTAAPGMAIVHHADSFALIRGGMIDVTVHGGLRGLRERGFRQLALSQPQGRRDRRRDGSRGLRQAGVYRAGAQHARWQAEIAAPLSIAHHRAGGGDDGGDGSGVV